MEKLLLGYAVLALVAIALQTLDMRLAFLSAVMLFAMTSFLCVWYFGWMKV